MHEVSQIGANQGEWHDRDLRRSIDFHALLLAMAGHDLRQNLQIILSTYGWLSARAASDVERECIASGQHAVMQMAEQLHQLVTALHIHQNSSQIALIPGRPGPCFRPSTRMPPNLLPSDGCSYAWFQHEAWS